uniref:Methyltransferase FkbM domain-containing protein n=1 Tax=Chlamydomonas euryale TaxID=1486919 RepID=A0A7R9VGC5_9CHLO|mmetsp:Transcript_34627/g.102791  ORF Transcript_34627/g.102791 Transcript_34627/m.102791 type:complete len:281 (+) Transcript_34627:697-1539(+)
MLGIRRIQSSTMRALMPIMLVLLAMLSGSVQSFNYTVRTNFPLTDFSQNQVSYGNATALLMQLQRHRVSQDGEEFRLYNDYFCGAENGTFLEMGALDGILLSNTYALEQGLNWGGVLIEANPVSYRALARNRPSAITIRSAVCATDNIVTFCQSSPQISGIWEFMSEGFKQQWYPNGLPASTIQLPCVPLSRLLHLARITHYNFFSLDVEGAELQVLKSINWQLVSFEVIVVEASNKEGDSAKTEQVRELLMHHGYKFDKHVHRNDWFIHSSFIPTKCDL